MDSQQKIDDEMIHMPFLHENITIEIPLHILQSLKPGQLVFPDPELHPYLYVVRTETGSHLFFKILILLFYVTQMPLRHCLIEGIQRCRSNFLALKSVEYYVKSLGDILDLENILHRISYIFAVLA